MSPEIARKGKRVAGMFLLMIGSGVILESRFVWAGGGIVLYGLFVYITGYLKKPMASEGADEALTKERG